MSLDHHHCQSLLLQNGVTQFEHRRAASSNIAKIVKRLNTSAQAQGLQHLNITNGTIDKRNTYFRNWIKTIKLIFNTEERYQSVLRNYPGTLTHSLFRVETREAS